VIESSAFDPALRAKVKVVPQKALEFLDDKEVRRIIKEKRGVAVFVPTAPRSRPSPATSARAGPSSPAAFYHGGEPIRVIPSFLEDEVARPFLLAMNRGGTIGANIPRARYRDHSTTPATQRRRPRSQRPPPPLPGRQRDPPDGGTGARPGAGARSTSSPIAMVVFEQLRPARPEFQLAGDAERVAVTCAAIGVDARDLDLPVPPTVRGM